MSERRLGWKRRHTWAALACVAALALGGCGFVGGAVDTERALERAGIHPVGFTLLGGVLTLSYQSIATPDELEAEVNRAAGIVWRNLPVRVDGIVVEPLTGDRSERSFRFSRQLLEELFGPRPDGLDRGGRDTIRTVVLWGVGAGAVLFVGALLIVLLVVRSARRSAAPGAGAGPGAGVGAAGPDRPGPWQQQPWQQQGSWQPQAPSQQQQGSWQEQGGWAGQQQPSSGERGGTWGPPRRGESGRPPGQEG